MSAFSDLLYGNNPDSLDAVPDEEPNPRVNIGAAEPFERAVIQKVAPEVEPYGIGGFATNFAKDVGRFGAGLGALMGEVVVHPLDSAEAVGNAALHPVDTAEKLAQPLIEKYTPQEDEGIAHMLARNAYEHPFDTLLDASTVIQGPFGAAAKVAKVAGAAELAGKLNAVADVGRAIDPITLAQGGTRAVLKKYAPDWYAWTRTMRANTDKITEEATKQEYLQRNFDQRLIDAGNDIQPDGSAGPLALTPAEHAIKFAYGEGRVPIINKDVITELTHNGQYESRKLEKGSAIRPEALDAWVSKFEPLRQEYEWAQGIAPEQYAEKARNAATRPLMYNPDGTMREGLNPFDSSIHDTGEQAYQSALADATERQQRRATVSTRTALDVAKEKDFRAKAAQLEIDESQFNELQKSMNLPHPWETPTVEEALQVMGPKGGIIIPHNMDILNREQSTVGNLLKKAQQASVAEENTGSRFRQGLLENHDPSAALSRYYQVAIRGKTMSSIAEDAAQMGLRELPDHVQEMPANWDPNKDPLVLAGKAQPLQPGSIAQDGSLAEHFSRLKGRLMEVAPYDKAAADVNLVDLAEHMTPASPATFPLSTEGGKIYRVSSGVGNALALFKQSLEPATNPFTRLNDNLIMGPFNMLTINMRAGHLVNRAAGHTLFLAGQGLTPFTARGFMGLLTAGRATLGHYGILRDEVSQKLAKVYDLPGVASGGISASDALRNTADLGKRLAQSENPIVSGIGKWAQMGQRANTNIDHIARAASTIYEMSPRGIDSVKGLIHGAATMADMGEKFDTLSKMGLGALEQPDYSAARTVMNRWLNDYKRTSALERMTGRYVFPYHKFYEHAAEVLLRAPFERPIRAQLARSIGGAALQDAKDQLASYGYDWNTMVPEGMRDSVPVKRMQMPDGSNALLMLNVGTANPFSFMKTSGDLGTSAVELLNPIVKVAIEQATGVNLFTREKFQGALSTFNGKKIDPDTGAIVEDYERPSAPEHYLRQYWPYKAIENIVSHGRVPRDGADLVDMARNAPGTYRLDEMGRQIENPQPGGALNPIFNYTGQHLQVLQPPTAGQARAQKTTTSEEFAKLYQQHPERRAELLAELRAAAGRYKAPAVVLPPRRGF